jgi:RNA recognition motif-containing protein
MVKLFIGGFPLDYTELELVQLVALHGTVNTVKIVRDKKTGICKGYAFLEMKSLADANNAVEVLNGRSLAGQTLTLKVNNEAAPAPPAKKPYRPAPAKPATYIKVDKPTGTVRPKRPRKA